MATTTTIQPIGIDDVVHVRGRHLVKKRDGSRFFVRGIAFPTPPGDDDDDDAHDRRHRHGYDPRAWLAVLRQLRIDLGLEFNVVRLYRLRPEHVDYSEFFLGAASLGVYVIVPLTSASGDGVLDRDAPAPGCYPRRLFEYGASALSNQYLRHPNVLAGVVGNEVMDGGVHFGAAPCVRAYSRDLKLFMDAMVASDDGAALVHRRTLPLIYASQDSSPMGGAALDKDQALRLTADYLTCVRDAGGGGSGAGGVGGENDDDDDEEEDGKVIARMQQRHDRMSPAVDIVGINVESWCSSTQNYAYNRDGTPGPYYHLHEALENASVPLIFTEMGCPHSQYDRDDLDRKTPDGYRDWADVSIVLNEMADTWSGFIAYAYDGPSDFDMMSGGPWNGVDVLTPTTDTYNFKMRLDSEGGSATTPRGGPTTTNNVGQRIATTTPPLRRCDEVEAELLSCCDVRLFHDDDMPSYRYEEADRCRRRSHSARWYAAAAMAAFALYWIIRRGPWRRDHAAANKGERGLAHHQNGDGGTKYGTIALS